MLFAGPKAYSAEASVVVINEDFESYTNTAALQKVWTGGTAQLLVDVPGGGQAALHDGSTMNKHGGFVVQPDATHNVVLTVDFYDFATNADKRVTVSLNNSSPDNLSMGINGGSSYAIRAGGFSATTNWIPFHRNQKPIAGWHRFQAVMAVSNITATLDFNADGKIDRRLNIPLTAAAPKFTQLRFGGLTGRPSIGGPVLVDNIRLEMVPFDPPVVVAETTPPKENRAAIVPSTEIGSSNTTDRAGTERSQPLNTGAAPAAATAGPWRPDTLVWWILAALGVIIALLLGVLYAIRRQGRAVPLAPLAIADASSTTGAEILAAHSGPWRARALQAEAIAAKQARILEEKVGPQLVDFAKQALVQGLYTQRNALLETQRKAEEALTELESRLADLELPRPQRIEAYEKRIAELEKELETRGEEMRELTRATLLLVREKLEEERSRSSGRFN